MGRRPLGVAVKGQRAVLRQRQGSLHKLTVSWGTSQLYELALRWFFQWMQANALVLPNSVWKFDEVICEAIESLWNEGESR